MIINVASFGGRSHMLDTARELEKFGHTVFFYSHVPTTRAIKYGLKKECSKSYFIIAIPFLLLNKLTKNARWSTYIYHVFFDYFIGFRMKRCDIFIGQSPLHVFSLRIAKQKFNSITILERGAAHISSMIKIHRKLPLKSNQVFMPKYLLERDLLGYELADYISIASDFQKRSFVDNGIDINKLLINPYGVSLLEFYPTKNKNIIYDVIYVGSWSYSKGCDLIIDAVDRLNINFLHVGSLMDLSFPKGNIRFHHVPSVDQKELIKYYSKAKVFVFATRQDGFGMVLSQALACGLPIVCTKYCGGRDLRNLLEDQKWIIEIPELTVEALVEGIKSALELTELQNDGEVRNYAFDKLDEISWEAYGKRYAKNIEKMKIISCE